MVEQTSMMLYFVKLILFYHLFYLKETANLHRSSCWENQKWKPIKLLCGENQTIYVKHHHIRNVIKTSNDTTYCDGQGNCSRGVTLPLNKEITYYSSTFAQTAKSCNDKRECTLHRTYFENMEETFPSSSITCHLGTLCHSVEYECIPVNWSHTNFSCQIIGRIFGMEILQTYQTGIRISSNDILLYEHEKFNTGVYGESFSLLTNQLTIEVQNAAVYSYILLKVQYAAGSHIQIRKFHQNMATENTSIEGFRDKYSTIPLIWISTVLILMLLILVIYSIIQQHRLLICKSTKIHVKAADNTVVLWSCPTNCSDLKIVMHKAECMCYKPIHLEAI